MAIKTFNFDDHVNQAIDKGTVHPNINNLLTLMLSQTCITFFLLRCHRYFEDVYFINLICLIIFFYIQMKVSVDSNPILAYDTINSHCKTNKQTK